MRAGNAIGVAVTVLAVAALAAFWQGPSLVAAGQQAVAQSQQAAKPKVEKPVVTIQKKTGSDPVVYTIQKPTGAQPRVVVREGTNAPFMAALAGGGPRLGVQIRDVGKDDLAKLKLTAQSGVVIAEVMDESAAQKAGVKAGDVVVQFDGENVRSTQQFTRLVRETAEGRTVKMALIRDGKRMDLDVTPEAAENTFDVFLDRDRVRSDLERELKGVEEQVQRYRIERRPPGTEQPMPPGGTFQWNQRAPMPLHEGNTLQWLDEDRGNFVFSMGRGRLGVTVQDLTPDLATYFGVKDGLLVSAVQGDSPAAKAGIKAGDIIGTVNGKAVSSSGELIKELADKDGEVTIGLTRDKKALSLKATLEARKTPARRVIVTGRPA